MTPVFPPLEIHRYVHSLHLYLGAMYNWRTRTHKSSAILEQWDLFQVLHWHKQVSNPGSSFVCSHVRPARSHALAAHFVLVLIARKLPRRRLATERTNPLQKNKKQKKTESCQTPTPAADKDEQLVIRRCDTASWRRVPGAAVQKEGRLPPHMARMLSVCFSARETGKQRLRRAVAPLHSQTFLLRRMPYLCATWMRLLARLQ